MQQGLSIPPTGHSSTLWSKQQVMNEALPEKQDAIETCAAAMGTLGKPQARSTKPRVSYRSVACLLCYSMPRHSYAECQRYFQIRRTMCSETSSCGYAKAETVPLQFKQRVRVGCCSGQLNHRCSCCIAVATPTLNNVKRGPFHSGCIDTSTFRETLGQREAQVAKRNRRRDCLESGRFTLQLPATTESIGINNQLLLSCHTQHSTSFD